MNWDTQLKPADLAESRLVSAILEGHFPIGGNLPAERALATQLGVTRPTLREVLQRMARDGWIEIRQGHSTRVKDYWREGKLGVLEAIARDPQHAPKDFVPNLLFVRRLMAPAYTRLAIERAREQVIALLERSLLIEDAPVVLAKADWQLHFRLTHLSENPIFTLILNGFEDLYLTMAVVYFSTAETRAHSKNFYRALLDAAQEGDLDRAETLTKKVMEESERLWPSASLEGIKG